MKVALLSYTQTNPDLGAGSPLRNGAGTPQESLIEFSGRVCYRSDALMGKNPAFIAARVREGHEDIVEHVRFVFALDGVPLDRTLLLLASQPTVQYTDRGGDAWVVSMNARNIRDFWVRSQSPLGMELMRLAEPIVPAVFRDASLTDDSMEGA